MNSKRKLIKKSRLYLITDKNIESAIKSLKAGADVVQLRIKEKDDRSFLKYAFELKKFCLKYNKLFLVNDRLDISLICGADGVHLGQNDIPVRAARKILGFGKIIGQSTHSLKEVKRAYADGADYIGIGPAFATATKSDYRPLTLTLLQKMCNESRLPYFVIGGINLTRLSKLTKYHIRRVAIFSSIIRSRSPYQKTKQFIKVLDR